MSQLLEEDENSCIADSTIDGLFVFHAFAGSYTSIVHSYSFGRDRFSPIKEAESILTSV
jgi:hypothetical protein